MLTLATNNRALYERNYAWLFGVNVLVAVLLLGVLVWIGRARLLLRLRKGRFGSRLLVKLAAIFALVGLMPGVLIYVVSYQFVTRSIESWFDVKVEGALVAGVNLARVSLESQAADMAPRRARPVPRWPRAHRPPWGWRWSASASSWAPPMWCCGMPPASRLAVRGSPASASIPERPSTALLRSVREQRAVTQIEGLDDIADPNAMQMARVKVLVLVTNPGLGLLTEPRFLQATLPLPPALVSNAIEVQEANREYQERALARGGLRRMYVGTLTLSLFLAVFGAVLLAVLLGNQLARPLLVLAEGVREVAAGNLSPKAALQGKDELGGLTRSFAMMTQQLADARAAVEQSMVKVDAARSNLQTILDNLTAGVIVLGEGGIIRSSNPGATRILRAPMAAYEGRPLSEVPGLADFAAAVERHFLAFFGDRDRHGLDHWQQPLSCMHRLLGRGSMRQASWRGAQSCPMRRATVGF
jgi:nitrogen fixation/metabolism regulation signal transduction histidine kinase